MSAKPDRLRARHRAAPVRGPATPNEVRSLDVRIVESGTRERWLWNELIARYHHLGYKTLVGAQMRYTIHDRNSWPLAMFGFSTAAWKFAPCDRFIVWTLQLREKSLPLVVDNSRFLILSPHLNPRPRQCGWRYGSRRPSADR